MSGDSLAPACETETFGGRRLDTDPVDADAGDVRDPGPHVIAMGADLRSLADQRDVEMPYLAAALSD